MKTRILQTVLITIFCLNAVVIFATTYTYETVSGVTGWRGGIAPPNPLPVADNVVIDANYIWYAVFISNGTVTVNAGKRLNVGQFTSNGTVINNGTIAMNGIFTSGATGVVTNNGTITIDYVSGGENALLSNFGLLNINIGSTLTIGDPTYALPNAARNETGGTTNIYGTVSNYSFWYNQAGSILNVYGTIASPNANHGSIANAGTINIYNGGTFSYHCLFDNTGLYNLRNPNEIQSRSVLGTVNLSNGGKIESNRSDFFNIGGNFNWASGGTVDLARRTIIASGRNLTTTIGQLLNIIGGGNLEINAGATFNNGGTLTIGNPFINSGTTTNSGTINNNYGITNNGTFTNSATLRNGTFSNSVGATFNNSGTFTSNYTYNSGTLTNTGIFNQNLGGGNLTLNTNPAAFPGGTFNWGAGQVIIGTNGVFPLSTNLTITGNQTLTVDGSMTVSNTSTLTNNGQIAINGTLTNNGILQSSSALFLNATGTLTNNGTLTNDYFLHRYSGTMNNAGTLRNNSTVTIETTGTMNNNLSGTVFNNGTFSNSNVFNNNGHLKTTAGLTGSFSSNTIVFGANSTIEPGIYPGRLAMPSDVNLSTATIIINCSSININDVLSRVAFSGNVNISNATLQIDWGTYTPVAGGSFKLLSFVSCTGQFANVNIPPISGLAFTLTYNTTNIVISVTSALPIELSTFTATEIQSQKAQLNWKTATETNVKNFDIEKSADGRKFEKIGEVEANNTPSVYFAFDDHFFESAYYRLKINDLDGQVAYSKIVSLEKNVTKGLKVYPNPAKHILTVENAKSKTLEIVNALGEVVLKQSNNEFTTINIQSLPNGIYFLKAAEKSVSFIKN